MTVTSAEGFVVLASLTVACGVYTTTVPAMQTRFDLTVSVTTVRHSVAITLRTILLNYSVATRTLEASVAVCPT